MNSLIGISLLEAAAQTFIGALAEYTFDKIKNNFFVENTFTGAFDLWQRGIHCKSVDIGDTISFDGLISPFIQLFPRDPYKNAVRWNSLYNFEGKITSQEFSNLEFYAGSDETIRTGSLNGETLVGLYNRYGYIGEGLLGVAPTKYILKQIPDFFATDFFGLHARITGTLSKCPTQHGFVAQGMFQKVGLKLNTDLYKEIPYIKINSIKVYKKEQDKICSLLGSPWAATVNNDEPYLVQYGYFSNPNEINECIKHIVTSKSWEQVKVFYDNIKTPDESLSFTKQFIL